MTYISRRKKSLELRNFHRRCLSTYTNGEKLPREPSRKMNFEKEEIMEKCHEKKKPSGNYRKKDDLRDAERKVSGVWAWN